MDIYTLGYDIGTNRSRIYDSLCNFYSIFEQLTRFRHVKSNKKSGSFTRDRSSDPRQPTETWMMVTFSQMESNYDSTNRKRKKAIPRNSVINSEIRRANVGRNSNLCTLIDPPHVPVPRRDFKKIVGRSVPNSRNVWSTG